MRSRVPRHAARGGSQQRWRLRARVLETGLAALAVVGLGAYASPAFANNIPVTAGSTCQNGPGSGWTVTWTVQNDENLPETGTVTAVTGGLSTLNKTTFSIAATPTGQPNSSTTLTQTLPASASGTVTLSVTGTWSDGSVQAGSDSYVLSSIFSCGGALPQKQTIGGQIHLCLNGNPTTTNVPGGTIGATGPETIKSVPDPMPATDVPAGSYTMTATDPPGHTLVACHGSGVASPSGLSASEAVAVPAGGNGEGIFYAALTTLVAPVGPSIALQESSLQGSFSGAGQTIDYHYLVTNTGNAALSHVTVADPRTGPSSVSCPDTTLATGADETCTATYVTTSTDVHAGEIVNTATATGTPPTGPNVTSAPSTITLTIPDQPASMSIVLSSSVTTYLHVGDPIHFHYHLTNTGDADLTDLVVTNSFPGVPTPNCGTTLDVGASETCHADYTVMLSDLDAGKIINTATATATAVDEPPVTATSNTVTLTAIQRITGHIFQCFSTGPTDLEVDGGTLGATGPMHVDTVPNPIHPPDPVPAGVYTMTATVPPGWAFVACPPATTPSIAPNGATATETVEVPTGGLGTGLFYVERASPAITIKQTVAQPYYTGAGQTVTFDSLVTNTGNVGLGDVKVTNTLAGVTALSCPELSLAAHASETCTGKYTTTAADVTAQSIANKATAHGTPPDLPAVSSSSSSATVDLLAVTVTKTASASSIVAGSTTPITYTLTVKNTGKVATPTPLNIADSAPVGTTMVSGSAACKLGGPPACTVAVAAPTVTWTIAAGVTPGQMYTLTFNVTANASDPSGNLTNTALWNGSACASGDCTTNTVTTPVTASSSAGKSSSGSGSLAFTGALLTQQWVVAMGAILAGGLLLVASHRRRIPKHAAATRWGLLEFLLTPRGHRDPSGERKD